MPTKLNKAGQQQNYVPAGNGDASGEYGDNATGSNKHFTNFKRPKLMKPLRKLQKQDILVDKEFRVRNEHWDLIKFKNKEDALQYIDENPTQRHLHSTKTELNKEHNEELFNELADTYIYEKYSQLTDKELTDIALDDNLLLQKLREVKTRDLENYINDDFKTSFGLNYWESNDYADKLVNSNASAYYDKIQNLFSVADKPRIEKGKEFLKTLPKINGKHSIEDDLKNTNPHYNPNNDDEYHRNCQRCSFVFALRRMGYDVSAQPNTDSFGVKKIWWQQAIYKEKHIGVKSNTGKNLVKKVEDIVSKAGDGAIYAVSATWNSGWGGHCWLVINDRGFVRHIDAQDNSVGEQVINYFARVEKNKGVDLHRLDNADFTTIIKNTVDYKKE